MSVQTQIDRLAAAKAAIVAAIIAKGVSVPSSALLDALDAYITAIETGADVSGVTTAAGDVLAGKKFVDANGVLRDGTMPYKGAATYTPGTSNQTIAAGQYLAGAQTIAGDPNLVAANIVKGKSIFGVAGSLSAAVDGKGTMFGRKFEVGTFTPTSDTKKIENISHSLGVLPTGLIIWATAEPNTSNGIWSAFTWYFETTNWTGIAAQARYSSSSDRWADFVDWAKQYEEYPDDYDASDHTPSYAEDYSGTPLIRNATTSKFSIFEISASNGSGRFTSGVTYNYIVFGGV